jgi:hypothetical protein
MGRDERSLAYALAGFEDGRMAGWQEGCTVDTWPLVA